jgi:hypothetical protein
MNLSHKPSTKKWIRFWIFGFLVINLVCHLSAGTNADSRFATLLAIAEDHTFKIDPYVTLTVDWARTPDGHFYSNKAPGPSLIAAPVFLFLEKLAYADVQNKDERVHLLIKYKATWLKLVSYLFQLIPFMWVAYFISVKLIEQEYSTSTVYLALAALLFGNTASVFMSTFYGHGMTAVWLLSMVLCARYGRYYGVGFCFGLSVLSDYSAVLLFFPLLFLIKRDARNFLKIVLGGVFPFALWSLYHTSCFGNPLHIANEFQNPIFKDVISEKGNLWGILLPFPNFSTLTQLIVGPSRGMIWVVPWILVLVGWSLVSVFTHRASEIPPELRFSIVGLGLLLWMNSCFGGWHGGLTPGPRYLSPIFPVFALSLALSFEKMNLMWQRALFVSVGISVLFTAFVYSTNISPELVPLWPTYLKQTLVNPTSSTVARLILVVPSLIVLSLKSLRWPRILK